MWLFISVYRLSRDKIDRKNDKQQQTCACVWIKDDVRGREANGEDGRTRVRGDAQKCINSVLMLKAKQKTLYSSYTKEIYKLKIWQHKLTKNKEAVFVARKKAGDNT